MSAQNFINGLSAVLAGIEAPQATLAKRAAHAKLANALSLKALRIFTDAMGNFGDNAGRKISTVGTAPNSTRRIVPFLISVESIQRLCKRKASPNSHVSRGCRASNALLVVDVPEIVPQGAASE